jgi:hypothetical protein
VIVLNSGSILGPPSTCGTTELLCCKQSSETQNNETVQTLTPSRKASGSLQAGLSSRRTLEVGLPRSQSRSILEAVVVAAIVLPNVQHFQPILACWHSAVPTIDQGSLKASVERVQAQVDKMTHDHRLRIHEHYHTCHFLNEFAPSAIG